MPGLIGTVMSISGAASVARRAAALDGEIDRNARGRL